MGHLAAALEDLLLPQGLSLCFNQPMPTPRIFTVDNHILTPFPPDYQSGQNNMDCHLLQKMRFLCSFINSGISITKSYKTSQDFLFRRSSIFKSGFMGQPFYIMLIMNKPSWQFFCPCLYFRGAWKYMEWSRTFPSPGYFFWRSRTSDQPLHAPSITTEI